MQLAELRQILGIQSGLSGRDEVSAPHMAVPLVRGSVIELLGPAKTEWLLTFLATQPQYKVFWCEQENQILPTAIQQRGVDLARVFFINSNADMFSSIRRVLQSQMYEVVVIGADLQDQLADLRPLRALQLLAEKSQTLVFLLANKQPMPSSMSWPISMQLQIDMSTSGIEDSFDVQILKNRFGG